jgi:hypothetical protein
MTAADRHLLFGLLALQNGIINQVQLVAAFGAWTLDKSRGLADHLEHRGDLSSARRALLEALVGVHLKAHGGDTEKSLAAVSAGKSTKEGLTTTKAFSERTVGFRPTVESAWASRRLRSQLPRRSVDSASTPPPTTTP